MNCDPENGRQEQNRLRHGEPPLASARIPRHLRAHISLEPKSEAFLPNTSRHSVRLFHRENVAPGSHIVLAWFLPPSHRFDAFGRCGSPNGKPKSDASPIKLKVIMPLALFHWFAGVINDPHVVDDASAAELDVEPQKWERYHE